MGEDLHPNLLRVAADVQRHYPEARVTWDSVKDPCMVIITVNGSKVRGFIEARDLRESGPIYRKWLDYMFAQIAVSAAEHEQLKRGGQEKSAP
jgi:hypothetical protein